MSKKFGQSMRNKLMLYVFTALVFMLIVTISIYYSITSYSYVEDTKLQLKIYSNVITDHINHGDISILDKIIDEYKKLGIDVILQYGENVSELTDVQCMMDSNILNEDEVIEGATYIKENGHMSYIVFLDNGTSIKATKQINPVKYIVTDYLPYYGAALIVIIFLSIWVAGKVAYIIVKPIRDLDKTSSMIASGELGRRVKVTSNDEIGQLAHNFNYMASKLEKSLIEVNEKQNRLSAILQSMESGVIAVDNKRNIIIINNYAKNMFGVDDSIVGCNVKQICSEYDFNDIFSGESNEVHEIILNQPVVKFLRVRCGDILVNSNKHIGAVAVIQDISDLKKLENMRSEFVANVSHELKTPLTSIKGFAETLRDVDDDETKQKFLDIINEESERLTRLISDILMLSQIEQNPESKHEYFEADSTVDSVMMMMKTTAEAKNISLSVQGDILGNMLGDEDRFKQMILNLVDNGIKYSENGDSVTVIKKNNKDNFIITVEDTGIGIPEESLSRLFERFYRVDKARSRAKGGTGLGLAIVKHIVIAFNGKIDIESKVGVGTKFIITIPK